MKSGHSLYDSTFGWKATLRYREPGAITALEADAWLAEAQAVYESTVVPMLLNGDA